MKSTLVQSIGAIERDADVLTDILLKPIDFSDAEFESLLKEAIFRIGLDDRLLEICHPIQ
jgi:hypothetical protein